MLPSPRLKHHHSKNRQSTQHHSNYRHAEVFLGDMPGTQLAFDSDYQPMRVSLVRHIKSELPINQIEIEDSPRQIKITAAVGWFMLFYQVFNAALVPCWLMGNLRCESFTRNSWRFFIVTAIAYPFMLHEQRTLRPEQEAQFAFRNMCNQKNIKVIYMRSMNYAMWVWCQVMASKFTSNNHAVNMVHQLTIMQFLLRVIMRREIHQFEIGGSLLVSLGLLLVFSDSLTTPQVSHPPLNERYLSIFPLFRVFGDLLGLAGAMLRIYMTERTPGIQTPPFTTFFLYNLFLSINFAAFGYFFGASSLSFDPWTGLFGLFTIENFVSIFYVSTFLGMSMLITNIFVTQIFTDYMIGFANVFEPIFSSCMYIVTNIEPVPKGLTCLGYAFTVPGSLLIIAGRGILTDMTDKIQLILSPAKE